LNEVSEFVIAGICAGVVG